MGCTSSKIDDLPAVALCRDRCYFLDEAIRQRYFLSDSHVAYIQSLKGFAFSFDRFFDHQDLDNFISHSSPLLPLPSNRKGGGGGDPSTSSSSLPNPPPPPGNGAAVSFHSSSNSGSHLHFHDSDDGEDDDDDDEDSDFSGSLHHDHDEGHEHHHHHHHETLESLPNNGYMTTNYMQNQPTQSVVYEQRPMSPETVHYGESSSSSYNPYSYPNYDNSGSYGYTPPVYSNYGGGSGGYYGYPPHVYSNYGGGGGGFFGSSSQYGSFSPPPQHYVAPSSSSKPPPPPPSPPRASAWDFLNPFHMEKYYPPQTPSRDSKELREEEGIPELEDEDYRNEVVKEVHQDQKFVDGSSGNLTQNVENEDQKGSDVKPIHQPSNSVSAENPTVEYEVHLVDKNVVDNGEQSNEPGNVGSFRGRSAFTSVSEIVREIKAQFERASESGIEVSKMLEAGKLPYNRKNAVYQVSSKMLHSITPPLSVVVSSSAEKDGSGYSDIEDDVGRKLLSLSSTLQKLYVWEKKLYSEVKVEERMRLVHDRKSRRLKRLVEKGAEAHKIDSTRTLVRALSTKIRIAIQIVEKISMKINKLRDEELWPQINRLIHRLVKMWKTMLECHRIQCQAIAEAKNLDAFALNRNLNDTNLEATVQLELELLNWILRFSSWIIAQKAFVKALNNWLLKCLLDEREETEDGMAPFSPGRMGAPPVFVICNRWSQAMDKISEKEVLDTMRVFAASVHHLCEKHDVELRQRMTANRDMERRVKAIEKEEQKMQKALLVVGKQMVLLSGQGNGLALPGQMVQPSDTINTISLQSSLKRIFEAMERFMASSVQAYEELRILCDEYQTGREHADNT